MIFGFWVNSQSSHSNPEDTPAFSSWRAEFPDFSLFKDDDVIPHLSLFGDDVCELYNRIRIPACKSDLARLILLYQFGGLYIDAHSGLGSIRALLDLFKLLSDYDVIFFDKVDMHAHESDVRIINGAMCARKRSEIIFKLATRAVINLRQQYVKEKDNLEYQPYNIFTITGAWNISLELFDLKNKTVRLRDDLVENVYVKRIERNADVGFRLHQQYSYRKPGLHWSERQKTERLFELPADNP
jgi:hypothetical protein